MFVCFHIVGAKIYNLPYANKYYGEIYIILTFTRPHLNNERLHHAMQPLDYRFTETVFYLLTNLPRLTVPSE